MHILLSQDMTSTGYNLTLDFWGKIFMKTIVRIFRLNIYFHEKKKGYRQGQQQKRPFPAASYCLS